MLQVDRRQLKRGPVSYMADETSQPHHLRDRIAVSPFLTEFGEARSTLLDSARTPAFVAYSWIAPIELPLTPAFVQFLYPVSHTSVALLVKWHGFRRHTC